MYVSTDATYTCNIQFANITLIIIKQKKFSKNHHKRPQLIIINYRGQTKSPDNLFTKAHLSINTL